MAKEIGQLHETEFEHLHHNTEGHNLALHKQEYTVYIVTKVYETLSSYPLQNSISLTPISNSRSKIANITQDEVNVRSISSEVISPQR